MNTGVSENNETRTDSNSGQYIIQRLS